MCDESRMHGVKWGKIQRNVYVASPHTPTKGLPITMCDSFLTEKVRRRAEREVKKRSEELII